MECMIDKLLKKIKRNRKTTKLNVIRRYLKMKINVDIGPIALNRRILRLELFPV